MAWRRNFQLVFLFLLIIGFYSCETDKDRIKEAKETVTTFVANTMVENSPVLLDMYPSFRKVGRYFQLSDFKIVDASVNKKGVVTITGKSSVGGILFICQKIDGNYKIINSKGLSPYFNEQLYKYCKAIGCITITTYDADVAAICEEKKPEFYELVKRIKNSIEKNFRIENNNLRLKGMFYGSGYVSGNITVKNNSNISIPGYSYQLYYDFVDTDGDVVFTKQEIANFNHIQFGESLTRSIFEDNAQNFSGIKVRLEITSTDFIEKIISEKITGKNCMHNLSGYE